MPRPPFRPDAAQADLLNELRALAGERDRILNEIERRVLAARAQGITNEAIAEAIGRTRRSIYRRTKTQAGGSSPKPQNKHTTTSTATT